MERRRENDSRIPPLPIPNRKAIHDPGPAPRSTVGHAGCSPFVSPRTIYQQDSPYQSPRVFSPGTSPRIRPSEYVQLQQLRNSSSGSGGGDLSQQIEKLRNSSSGAGETGGVGGSISGGTSRAMTPREFEARVRDSSPVSRGLSFPATTVSNPKTSGSHQQTVDVAFPKAHSMSRMHDDEYGGSGRSGLGSTHDGEHQQQYHSPSKQGYVFHTRASESGGGMGAGVGGGSSLQRASPETTPRRLATSMSGVGGEGVGGGGRGGGGGGGGGLGGGLGSSPSRFHSQLRHSSSAFSSGVSGGASEGERGRGGGGGGGDPQISQHRNEEDRARNWLTPRDLELLDTAGRAENRTSISPSKIAETDENPYSAGYKRRFEESAVENARLKERIHALEAEAGRRSEQTHDLVQLRGHLSTAANNIVKLEQELTESEGELAVQRRMVQELQERLKSHENKMTDMKQLHTYQMSALEKAHERDMEKSRTSSMSEQAREQKQTMEEQARDHRQTMEEQARDHRQEMEAVQVQLSEKVALVAALKVELAKAVAERDAAAVERGIAVAMSKAAKNNEGETDGLRDEVERLRRELIALEEQKDSEVGTAQEQKNQVMDGLEELAATVEMLTQRLEEVQLAKVSVEDQLHQTEAKLIKTRCEVMDLSRECDEAKDRARAKERDLEMVVARSENVEVEWNKSSQSLASLIDSMAELHGKIKAERDKVTKLEQHKRLAGERVATLMIESTLSKALWSWSGWHLQNVAAKEECQKAEAKRVGALIRGCLVTWRGAVNLARRAGKAAWRAQVRGRRMAARNFKAWRSHTVIRITMGRRARRMLERRKMIYMISTFGDWVKHWVRTVTVPGGRDSTEDCSNFHDDSPVTSLRRLRNKGSPEVSGGQNRAVPKLKIFEGGDASARDPSTASRAHMSMPPLYHTTTPTSSTTNAAQVKFASSPRVSPRVLPVGKYYLVRTESAESGTSCHLSEGKPMSPLYGLARGAVTEVQSAADASSQHAVSSSRPSTRPPRSVSPESVDGGSATASQGMLQRAVNAHEIVRDSRDSSPLLVRPDGGKLSSAHHHHHHYPHQSSRESHQAQSPGEPCPFTVESLLKPTVATEDDNVKVPLELEIDADAHLEIQKAEEGLNAMLLKFRMGQPMTSIYPPSSPSQSQSQATSGRGSPVRTWPEPLEPDEFEV